MRLLYFVESLPNVTAQAQPQAGNEEPQQSGYQRQRRTTHSASRPMQPNIPFLKLALRSATATVDTSWCLGAVVLRGGRCDKTNPVKTPGRLVETLVNMLID